MLFRAYGYYHHTAEGQQHTLHNTAAGGAGARQEILDSVEEGGSESGMPGLPTPNFSMLLIINNIFHHWKNGDA